MSALVLALALSADPRAELKMLEARQRAEETAAQLIARQERSVLDTLGESEEALALAEGEWRQVEQERAAAEAALGSAREAERRADEALSARLSALRPRLVARARMGKAGVLPVLLSAGTLSDLVKRRYLFDRILSRDAALVAAARQARAEREAARAAQETVTANLAALAIEAEERKASAEARREERRTLLSALRTARSFHERAASEISAQAGKLGELVSALPPRSGGTPASHFAERRGRLPRPADGAITVGFGRVVNPKFNTVTVQNGIDIAAPAGAPVRAVAPGRVVHAGWFRGYGNLVIVDHGAGYHTLVAHLGTMRTAMGEDVEGGDVLGTVGDSGSLKGPYLYFEVRERGRPVDPRPWLAPQGTGGL